LRAKQSALPCSPYFGKGSFLQFEICAGKYAFSTGRNITLRNQRLINAGLAMIQPYHFYMF
jgi:hypothetical protein